MTHQKIVVKKLLKDLEGYSKNLLPIDMDELDYLRKTLTEAFLAGKIEGLTEAIKNKI